MTTTSRPRKRRSALQAGLLCAAMMLAHTVRAGDEAPSITATGFGTIGAARTDQPWGYQRFLRDRVSFERDSVFGLQVDARLSNEWSATVQAKLAPSVKKDSSWTIEPAWAFAAWRPNNEWLVRAGKLRVPLYLRSEVLDVGQTYEEARLPAEIYSLAPTNDFSGIHLTRSFLISDGELNLDVYSGTTKTYKRAWLRDSVPSPVPGQPVLASAGAQFRAGGIAPTGVVLTWRDDRSMFRAGLHHMTVTLNRGEEFIDAPVWAPLGPGLGYWQTSNLLPGPGVTERRRFNEWILTLGADWKGSNGWRYVGEYGRVRQQGTRTAVEGWSVIASVYKTIGPFVPYATFGYMRSSEDIRKIVRDLESTSVPSLLPGAAVLNASMRAQADRMLAYQQYSLTLGSAYNITPTSKLKLEWMHGWLGANSLIDLPSGEPLERGRGLNVFSASYSFVF